MSQALVFSDAESDNTAGQISSTATEEPSELKDA
jgi:hypothetical protein